MDVARTCGFTPTDGERNSVSLVYFLFVFLNALMPLLRVCVSVQIPNRLQSLAVPLHPVCTLSPPPVFTVLLPSNWAQISWLHQPAAAQLGTKPHLLLLFLSLLPPF